MGLIIALYERKKNFYICIYMNKLELHSRGHSFESRQVHIHHIHRDYFKLEY